MENKVKPATNPTIKILNDCNIRTIMATGDNILTAIAVGKECNILSNDLVNVYFGDISIENGQEKLVWKNAS